MKTFLMLLGCVLSAGAALGAARESVVLTNGWRAVYCEGGTERPAAEAWGVFPAHPENPWWGNVDFRAASVKPSKGAMEYDGMWLEREEWVPAEWQGRRVHVEVPVPMRRCDAVVFVNGTKMGEVLRPGGLCDVTRGLTFGATNVVALYLTHSGAGTERGETKVNKWDNGLAMGLMHFPRLVVTEEAFVTDVFANTSVQRGELVLEVEVDAARAEKAQLVAVIRDAAGAEVKRVEEAVELKGGVQTLSPTVPWKDPHFWDFGDGYLYTCEVELRVGDRVDAFPAFRFGFREIWREGKELFINGRPLHLRTCYGYGTKTRNGMAFLQSIGYTALAMNHDVNGFPNYPPEALEHSDELGIGIILSAGMPRHISGDDFVHNEAMQAEYEAYQRVALRKWRNHPSLVAAYVSQMIICNGVVGPAMMGMPMGEGGRNADINKAREINRKFNPNILYYSHADGSNGDLASGNLYFNWTPHQESDEWLHEWEKQGKYPWHGSEFDSPYSGCWWYGGGFGAAEHMARFVGDAAYETEPLRALEAAREMSANNRSGHGAAIPTFDFEIDWPYYWVWRRGLVSRMNRHWRGYGFNGGNIWFNIAKGYGTVTNDVGWCDNSQGAYNHIEGEFDPRVRPEWVNEAYDIYQIGNRDFCGYLAGAPEQADKTHAFFAGETVTKAAAFIWDGAQPKAFSASWKAVLEGEKRAFASGTLSRTMKPGEIAFEPITFAAPKVREKKVGRMELEYSDGTSDSFAFEVYPAKVKKVSLPRGVRVALYDPAGEDAAMLRVLGIAFTEVETPAAAVGQATHLVVGRRALDAATLGVSAAQLASGMRVLVMPQTPAVWQSLGFQVQDAMARDVFLRDKANPAFAGVSDDTLRYWRGAPDYGPAYKGVMAHAAHRGPRGGRRHTVAGLLLKVPEMAGFVPLMDAHFDLNYAALLRFVHGAGALTLCTLDVEGRVGVDPAATDAARAVLTDFVTDRSVAESAVECVGAQARRMVEPLGFAVAESGAAGVVLVGRDAEVSWADVEVKAAAGATVVVVAHPRLAKEAGLQVEARQVMRAKGETDAPILRAFSPALLRWRDLLKADVIVGAPKGTTVLAEGLFAERKTGKGRVVFCQIDPEQLAERYAQAPAKEAVEADAKAVLAVVREILEEAGAPKAGETAGKGVQGEWWNGAGNEILQACGVNRGGRDGVVRVLMASASGTTRWQTSWPNIRKTAERGETVVVFRGTKHAEEAGFTVAPQELVDHLSEGHRFAVEMPVHRFTAAPEGGTLERDGLVGKLPVGEGCVIFAQVHPFEYKHTLEDWKRLKNSADVSVQRMQQMLSRLLTHVGARSTTAVAQRSLTRAGASNFQPLGALYVLGPFKGGSEQGETMAIAGDFNPNIEIPKAQGGTANWRPIYVPDAEGSIDFASLVPEKEEQTLYGICPVTREREGSALLRFGSEYRGRIWCNGELVLDAGRGVTCPIYELRIPLKKGENMLAFKLGAGNEKGRFWGLLEREHAEGEVVEAGAADLAELYLDLLLLEDPDKFLYW